MKVIKVIKQIKVNKQIKLIKEELIGMFNDWYTYFFGLKGLIALKGSII